MNRDEFLIELEDALQVEKSISYETVLSDLDEWDSLSKMAVLALFDSKLGVKITFSDLENISTVEDLAQKGNL